MFRYDQPNHDNYLRFDLKPNVRTGDRDRCLLDQAIARLALKLDADNLKWQVLCSLQE